MGKRLGGRQWGLEGSWQVALGEGGICTRWSCNTAEAEMAKQPELGVK